MSKQVFSLFWPNNLTDTRNDKYLTAIDKQALAPPKDMDAIQIRPDKSWSATVRNRFRPLSIVEWNLPKVI